MKIDFHHSDCSRQSIVIPDAQHIKVEYLKQVPDLVEGRQLSRSEVAFDDSRTRYKGLSALDFCLENQLAAGVDLKFSQVSMSQFQAVDACFANVVKLSFTSKSA
jgi:hypothetical protein